MLILGFTWGMIVSAISPANASGELNLGLGYWPLCFPPLYYSKRAMG